MTSIMTPTRLILASLLGLLVTACASDNQGHPPSAPPSEQTTRGTSLAVLGDRYTITIPEGYEQLDQKTSAEATNTFFFNREQNKGLGFTEGGTPENVDCGPSGSDCIAEIARQYVDNRQQAGHDSSFQIKDKTSIQAGGLQVERYIIEARGKTGKEILSSTLMMASGNTLLMLQIVGSGSDQASLDTLTRQILDTLKPRQQTVTP